MKRWLQDRRGRSGPDRSHALDGAMIGDLEGPTAVVDRYGRVGAVDGSWWVEWGVGAQDRWRVAHDEVAVRQSRVADAPVYETWMRVPGGDIVARVASANDGLGRVLVLEFENLSRDAVSLAVVGRVAGTAAIAADADGVAIDGIEWIRGERPAGGVLATIGDPWDVVADGPDASRSACHGDGASGGIVLALPHRQKVQVHVLVEGDFPTRPVTPDEISAGWRTITAGSLAIDVPDVDLGEAWNRILPDLIVQAGSLDPRTAAEAAVALDIAGLHDEADRGRATVVAAAEDGTVRGVDAVAALRALASRDLLAGHESGLADLAGPLAAAAGTALDAPTLSQVARALEAVAPAAAADARAAAARAVGTFAPDSAPAAAADRVLASVVAAPDPGVVHLLPSVPEAWLGQPIDVRSCGTPNGRVSFSIRWHGPRPALLWERLGGSDAVELRCPGLDPSWSSLERSGEALLAEPPS
ncbi:MAG: hypothetical protein R2707_20510 [Acidimicrobiales bacterium]